MLILALTVSCQVGTLEKYRRKPLIITIVVSPPILLLAERANFDILILVLVAMAGLLFSKNYHFLALLPLSVATLLKFYTLPIFLLFFILNNNKRRKLFTSLFAVLVSARIFLDLKLIQSSFPSGFSWKFGASIWTRYLTQLNIPDPGELVDNLSGIIVFIFICGTTFFVLKRMEVLTFPKFDEGKKAKIFFYLFFGTHISCYLLGMSFDYRLVFLALASIVYLDSFVSKKDSLFNIVLALTIISLWLSYPSSGLEPIGDLATEAVTAILGIRFIQLLKLDLELKNAK